jgi:hypothetical protein
MDSTIESSSPNSGDTFFSFFFVLFLCWRFFGDVLTTPVVVAGVAPGTTIPDFSSN